MRTINTRWVYNTKIDGSTAELLRCRAWLVVKGFTQIKGLHYFEFFAAVVQYESLRMFFTIIAAKELNFWLIDFVSAYFNVELQGEIYVELPQGYKEVVTQDFSPGDYILKMRHAMYGTMDTGNAWFNKLNKTLTAQGHVQSH